MMQSELRQGAENLLIHCAGLSAGDTLLVLRENPARGYYDQTIADAILACARDMDIRVELQPLPFDQTGADLPPTVIADMKRADRTLFLSRRGDQIRFDASMQGIRPIMSYALDAGMLASGFGRANHRGFVRLKNAVNDLLAGAAELRVTCPLGTDFRGPGPRFPPAGATDVTVDRFPMLVFAPVPASGYSGVVVQDGFLVGTGSRFYQPYSCALRDPLTVHFEDTRLTRFTGSEDDVRAARDHYEQVGQKFVLDPWSMHSWHAGLHPGCAYTQLASENFERWSGAAFGNPRLLHFHTCGHYAPGEISLNVLDPTITVDGVAIWKDGVFDPHLVPGGTEILSEFPCIRSVFASPARAVGQSPEGRLSAD